MQQAPASAGHISARQMRMQDARLLLGDESGEPRDRAQVVSTISLQENDSDPCVLKIHTQRSTIFDMLTQTRHNRLQPQVFQMTAESQKMHFRTAGG